MGNAIWLLLVLPQWFLETITQPFSMGYLTAVPALAVFCLPIGIGLGFLQRKRSLLLYIILPFGSECLVAIAGLFRGKVPENVANPITLIFLLAELLGALLLIWKSAGGRAAAAFLSTFALGYAFFATFVAAMAFGDNWI